jgi:hypothetical protein
MKQEDKRIGKNTFPMNGWKWNPKIYIKLDKSKGD